MLTLIQNGCGLGRHAPLQLMIMMDNVYLKIQCDLPRVSIGRRYYPQQRFVPSATLMLSTPSTASAATSDTPVSRKFLPGVFAGNVPSFANCAIASIPRDAINNGYCCDVAAITPSATFLTPNSFGVNWRRNWGRSEST